MPLKKAQDEPLEKDAPAESLVSQVVWWQRQENLRSMSGFHPEFSRFDGSNGIAKL